MTATVNANDGREFGLDLTTSVDIDPYTLGQGIARMSSPNQRLVLLGFAERMQEFGLLEWRMQAGYIGVEFKDAKERHVVDEVFGEILAQLHTMDDRAEDARA